MIRNKNELSFYIQADHMMNRGVFKPLKKQFLQNLFLHDTICDYLKELRKAEYYRNHSGVSILKYHNRIKLRKLSEKLGFSIACNVFGYGLVIPHHGTIVVGEGNIIGDYCVLHTSTCITAGSKKIGKGLYVSTGAKLVNDIILGDGITIGANAVVNKNYEKSNAVLAGIPAKFIKESELWYSRDGIEFERRQKACEELKRKMNIQ